MTPELATLSQRATGLRRAFDATFIQPPPPPPARSLALLLIRGGGHPYAVAHTALIGMARADTIAPVPSPASAFLGVAKLRGDVYPVWSLAGLVSDKPGHMPESTGRLLLWSSASGEVCAFACDEVVRTFFVEESRVAAAGRAESFDGMRQRVPCESQFVPLLELSSLVAKLQRLKNPIPHRT